MKRPVVLVSLSAEGGVLLSSERKSAFNSGVRASEALVRQLARQEGQNYEADRPVREGVVYTRRWTGGKTGRVVLAHIEKLADHPGSPLTHVLDLQPSSRRS
jgi:hypothetical protein